MEKIKPRSNKRLVVLLMLVVSGMFGFGYALVPLYDLFCEITGIGGKPIVAEVTETPQSIVVDTTRDVTVEFTTVSTNGLAWEVEPEFNKVKVNPGEILQVNYVALNTANRETTAQAVPSVAPFQASKYLVKMECFCFTSQKLAPGTAKVMPVVFYIDPDVPKDINTFTLAYSLFEVEDKEIPAKGT